MYFVITETWRQGFSFESMMMMMMMMMMMPLSALCDS